LGLNRAPFDRVTPRRNIVTPKKNGWGATKRSLANWSRTFTGISTIVDSKAGGQNQTGGLIWFLNPNMKCPFY